MEGKVFAALPWVLFLPGAGALLAGFFGRAWGGRFAATVTTGAMVSSFGVVLYALWFLFGEADPTVAYYFDVHTFIETRFLDIHFGLQFDRVSSLAAVVVTGVGSTIQVLALWRKPGVRKGISFASLNVLVFSLLLLVLGQNLLVMLAGWGGVGLGSYLLVGYGAEEMSRARAAQTSFVVARVGDFGFLVAVLMLVIYNQGIIDLASLEEWSRSGAAPALNETNMTVICLFLVLAVAARLGQMPSCLSEFKGRSGASWGVPAIHAAALLFASAFVLVRCSFLFEQAPMARMAALGVGVSTLAWVVYRIWFYGAVGRLVAGLRRTRAGGDEEALATSLPGSLVGRTTRRGARFCAHVVDSVLIDFFAVQVPARVVGFLGVVARALHKEDVQNYLLAIVVGLASLWIVL